MVNSWLTYFVVSIICCGVKYQNAEQTYTGIPQQPRTVEYYFTAATQLRAHYSSGDPFPHVIVDDFFPVDLARHVAGEFLAIDTGAVIEIPNTYALSQLNAQYLKLETIEQSYSPAVLFLLNHMKSSAFVTFLENLTGIKGLVADPHYYGSGLHQTLSGGHLAIHLDYNYNQNINMWRRVNVFLYLNEDWDEEWGGNLELWNADMSAPVVSIPPLFNRLVVFEASEHSWHGHPDPLRCPSHISRKSIAMYYYTAVDNPEWYREVRATQFEPRAGIDTWAPAERYNQANS